uniref:Uncharacterized protein n=1 Tax=viral metagenome TaxID=1070528 RepID=A0A6C0KB14_9ZZZZ
MEQGLDHNGDGTIDVYDSQALLVSQQSFNSRESLGYIVGNAAVPDDQFLTSSGDSRQYLFYRPSDLRDGSTVVTYKCKASDTSSEVWLYKVVGGGHTWPGSGLWWDVNMDIDSAVEAVKFFGKFNTQTPFDMENIANVALDRRNTYRNN